MKHLLLFVFLFTGALQAAAQRCALTLTTQSQVDAVPASGCTTLDALTIYGGSASSTAVDQIVDLTPLQGITAVTGSVSLILNDLTNIRGLDNIRTIGGELYITGATSAANPFALGSSVLESVGGNVIIYSNPGITALTGFRLLRSAKSVSIWGNAALGAVIGFDALQSTGTLQLYQCPVLRSISGFGNLTTVMPQVGQPSATFGISNNPLLQSIPTFPSLTTVDAFSITDNPVLQQVTGFNSLRDVQLSLTITNNGITSLSGFNGG